MVKRHVFPSIPINFFTREQLKSYFKISNIQKTVHNQPQQPVYKTAFRSAFFRKSNLNAAHFPAKANLVACTQSKINTRKTARFFSSNTKIKKPKTSPEQPNNLVLTV
jgi:hypothetical protein